MHVLCALNPAAGNGLPLRRWPRIVRLLQDFGITWQLLADREVAIGRQVAECLRSAGCDAFSAVLGIGGDGTHSAVLNALMRLRNGGEQRLPPYSLLPLGTGNDIAKSFGIRSSDLF
ncbi:MAG: acylglycerol kinase family protein, partial [Kiritimatiellia bacterium]